MLECNVVSLAAKWKIFERKPCSIEASIGHNAQHHGPLVSHSLHELTGQVEAPSLFFDLGQLRQTGHNRAFLARLCDNACSRA